MTALLFMRILTVTRLVFVPSLLQLSSCTSVHVLISLMALSSGSGIAISWSSSSWASASKCDTMNWPEWIVSRSVFLCWLDCCWDDDDDDEDDAAAADCWFMVRLDVGGGDGLFEPVNQLSRSSCCWCDILFAIFAFECIDHFTTIVFDADSHGIVFLCRNFIYTFTIQIYGNYNLIDLINHRNCIDSNLIDCIYGWSNVYWGL